MRKEIKRSLLVWPLMAAAAVSSIGVVGTLDWSAASKQLRAPISMAAFQASSRAVSVRTQVDAAFAHWFVRGSSPGVESAMSASGLQKHSDNLRELLVRRDRSVVAPSIDLNRELAGLSSPATKTSQSFGGLDDSFLTEALNQRDETKSRDSLSRLVATPGVLPEITASAESVLPASIGVLGKYERTRSAELDNDDLELLLQPSDADDDSISMGDQYANVDTDQPSADHEPLNLDEPALPRKRKSVGSTTESNPASWPTAKSLHASLGVLSDQADTLLGDASEMVGAKAAIGWAGEVSSRLRRLEGAAWLGDAKAGGVLQDLVTFAMAGEQMAEATQDRDLQLCWLQSVHGLQRRLAVWGPIWKVVESGARQSIDGSAPVYSLLATDAEAESHARQILQHVTNVRRVLPESGDFQGWSNFLLLDDIVVAANYSNTEQRAELAQRFLSRLEWYGLNAEHKIWLQHEAIGGLAEALQTWSVTPIDYAQLVRQLERQEDDAIDLSSIDIADAVQSLRFSKSAPSVAVADAINQHYRNANMRFAVSAEMLRRLLPPVDAKVQPVRTSLLGSRIVGTSQIHSELDLELVPASDRWSMRLRTDGRVHTDSVGLNGPVAVKTLGRSVFASRTPIELLKDSVRVGSSTVSVNNQNRLQGIRSDYDGLPLIGSLVRSIAASRYQDTLGIADRFARNRVERSVKRELDSQVQSKLSESTQRFSDVVVGPLGRLGLEPQVTDMQTTSERLLARYRLAGDWQMAAFTPRPRAPRESLLSLQLHQSAINNSMEQLVPRDEPMSIAEVVSSGMLRFGASGQDVPSDLPTDVMVQFASTRPVTVEIDNGEMWLTMRIVELTRGDQLNLRKFIVRAKYRGMTDGTNAMLVRDGSLQISGPRMSIRQRLPLRAIFNQILDDEKPLPITTPQLAEHPAVQGLAMSQLELRDGWIAIAMSEEAAPRLAMEMVDAIKR